MRQHKSPLAAIARTQGVDAPELQTLLTNAGLPASVWRAYRLLQGRAKLRPAERAALAAALGVDPSDLTETMTTPRKNIR